MALFLSLRHDSNFNRRDLLTAQYTWLRNSNARTLDLFHIAALRANRKPVLSRSGCSVWSTQEHIVHFILPSQAGEDCANQEFRLLYGYIPYPIFWKCPWIPVGIVGIVGVVVTRCWIEHALEILGHSQMSNLLHALSSWLSRNNLSCNSRVV